MGGIGARIPLIEVFFKLCYTDSEAEVLRAIPTLKLNLRFVSY